jgi:hypothetical protein
VGTKNNILVVAGDEQKAWKVFGDLAAGGTLVKRTTYDGVLIRRPDGGTVGLRMSDKHGITIDLNIPNESVKRIHFE